MNIRHKSKFGLFLAFVFIFTSFILSVECNLPYPPLDKAAVKQLKKEFKLPQAMPIWQDGLFHGVWDLDRSLRLTAGVMLYSSKQNQALFVSGQSVAGKLAEDQFKNQDIYKLQPYTKVCLAAKAARDGFVCLSSHPFVARQHQKGDLLFIPGVADAVIDRQHSSILVLNHLTKCLQKISFKYSIQPKNLGKQSCVVSIFSGANRIQQIGINKKNKHRNLPAPANQLVVAGMQHPWLQLVQWEHGINSKKINFPIHGPVRDFQVIGQFVIAVGPSSQLPVRSRGILEKMGDSLFLFKLNYSFKDRTDIKLIQEFKLAEFGLVDATKLMIYKNSLFVSAMASRRVVEFKLRPLLGTAVLKNYPDEDSSQNDKIEFNNNFNNKSKLEIKSIYKGIVTPDNLTVIDDWLLVGSKTLPILYKINLARSQIADGKIDQIKLYSKKDLSNPDWIRQTKEDLNSLLFYESVWQNPAGYQYSCNSCHWDFQSDGRLQPGNRQKRIELTRPIEATLAMEPIFSPGQSEHMAMAVEGLFRGLAADNFQPAIFSLQSVWPNKYRPDFLKRKWPLAGRDHLPNELSDLLPSWESGIDVQRGLLTALKNAKPSPGYFLGLAEKNPPGFLNQSETMLWQQKKLAWVNGRNIFLSNCERCHRAKLKVNDRQSRLELLGKRALYLGSAGLVKSGILPYFTEDGNRVTPLKQLTRYSAFFTHGQFSSLSQVLMAFDPERRSHGVLGKKHSRLNEAQVTDLKIFLLSL